MNESSSRPSTVLKFQILVEILERILSGKYGLEEVTHIVLEKACSLIGVNLGQILLLEGDVLTITASTNIVDIGSNVSVNDSVCGLAIQQMSPLIINDVSAEIPYKHLYKPFLSPTIKSEMVVLLLAEDKPLGVINLESEKPFAFTKHHQDLVQTLAAESILAIRTARYIEDLFRRRKEQQLIAEIQEEILSKVFEREAVLALILTKGLELVNAKVGQILLRDGDKLFIRSSTIWADIAEGTSESINDSVTGLALILRKPVRVDDFTTQKPYCDIYKPIMGKNMSSELAVPLIIGNDVVGVLNFESERKNAFTQDDERILVELSRQAALTLRLSGAFADIAALGRVQNEVLSNEYSLQETSDLILDYLRQLIGSETGQVLILDGERLTITASTNKGDIGTLLDVNDSVQGMAILENRPINVSNLQVEERYRLKYKRFLGPDMLSELVVPLRVGDKIFGVLNAESPRENAFSLHHVDLLTFLAGQAAMAIRIAEQIELQRKVSEQEKLAAVGEKSGDIVHRLANPSGAIRQRIELVRQKKADLLNSDEYLARSFADIDSNAQKIQAMVREMKESTSERLSGYIIRDVVFQAKERANIPEIIKSDFSIPANLPMVRATQKIVDVIYNLLRNAVEVMPQGGEISVSASLSEDNQFIDVTIQDTGPGIPNELFDEIFKPYFTTKSEEGHGLGLWWSRAYIEKCGGKLILNSKMGEGSTFTLRLPVYE